MNTPVYFDNAATTPLCGAAKDAMCAAMDTYGNPSSLHTLGVEAEKLVSDARRAILASLGVRPITKLTEKQLIFTASGTEADNLALLGAISAKGFGAGKKVLITGTGGTSKTARAVALAMGARCVVRVSRTSREDAVSYEELYERHSDAEVIVNTTPVGMYPRIAECPVELSKFTRLEGAVDAVYNPLSTPFVLEARARGAAAEGGLYMLVAQAVRASEIFLDTVYPKGTIDEIYGELLLEKENIVLTGMPASGKSTVGGLLARMMNRELIDTDELVKRNTGMEITDIFAKYGEEEFRRLESEAIASVAALTSRIIATGGGAILRDENVSALKKNGRLFFIDRPPERLIPTSDRPLSSDRDAILNRYNERYERYCNTADVRIDADCTPDEVAEKILKRRKSI